MSITQSLPCRHEHVKIFQRRLKGLERRLVATRAYLPVGFKATDLGHLGEGSYCFCTTCRARLYPRRTQAEKAQARAALAASKLAAQEALSAEEVSVDDGADDAAQAEDQGGDIDVEELEQESVDVQDIEAEGVKLCGDDSPCESMDED